MVYKGENNLIVQCKNKSECRVLLNRADLIELNKLEWCISKTIIQKSVIKTILLNQIEGYRDYLEETSLKDTSPSNTEHEMEVFIKLGTPLANTTTSLNLACQIQMYATMQLFKIWVDRRRARNIPELFAESETRLISPPRYSIMSPMHEDLSQARVADEECGIDEFLSQINPTQGVWTPIQKTKSMVDFHDDGNEPLFKQKLKRYMIGGESINLQLNTNIGKRPSGPIEFLFSKKIASGEDRFKLAFNDALFKFGKLKSPKSKRSSFGREEIRLSNIEKYSLYKEDGKFWWKVDSNGINNIFKYEDSY
ncbi:hypothetical protein QTP88_005542 [Uroleucon formosanum]